MSTWQKAYAELEDQIHDLPRWVHIVQTLHDAKFGPGMDVPDERDETLTLAIDELYGPRCQIARHVPASIGRTHRAGCRISHDRVRGGCSGTIPVMR
jgi:hypothetical protein